MCRRIGGLPSAARWRRCAPAAFRPSLRLRSLFPLADRRPKPLHRPAGYRINYSDFRPAALAFAHLALAAAEIFARPAALIPPFALGAALTATFFTLAHRALAAAEIFARWAALIVPFFFGAIAVAIFAGEPKIRPSSFSNDWIFSFKAAALRNCETDNCVIELMPFS